jgi:hypothetical protein
MVLETTRDDEGTPQPFRVDWSQDGASQWRDAVHALSDLTYYAT